MRPIRGNLGQNLTRWAPAPEILDKTLQDAPQPRKSWTKPHNMSPNPRKSQTKPHMMRPIHGSLDKTSHDEPYPRKSRKIQKKLIQKNPEKNLTRSPIYLVVGCCCSDKLCRGPLRGGIRRSRQKRRNHQSF